MRPSSNVRRRPNGGRTSTLVTRGILSIFFMAAPHNGTGVLAPGGEFPRLLELVQMQATPLAHQPQRPRRERAGEDTPVGDHDQRLPVAVLGVEVRRSVIPPVDEDDDPVEGRDPGRDRASWLTVPRFRSIPGRDFRIPNSACADWRGRGKTEMAAQPAFGDSARQHRTRANAG
jgi:hypothetical protein